MKKIFFTDFDKRFVSKWTEYLSYIMGKKAQNTNYHVQQFQYDSYENWFYTHWSEGTIIYDVIQENDQRCPTMSPICHILACDTSCQKAFLKSPVTT